jgi:hypothetical protein
MDNAGVLPAMPTPPAHTRSPRRIPGTRSQWLTLALALAVFAISFAINNDNVKSTELHPDETRWLNRAYYIEDFGDPYGLTWQDYYLTRGQPPGGSYLMGIGLLLQGKSVHPNGVWDFHHSREWNEAAGAIPSNDVLWAGRRTNAVVGALAVMLTFVVTSMLTNRVGGVLAALFLAFHPLFITLSTQALSDQLLALSLATTFVAAFQFARNPKYGWALLMGVALGVGGATKLAPLALSFVLAGFGVLWLIWRWRTEGRKALGFHRARRGLYLLVQPVIAGFVFVAMYPFLWVDPIGRALDLLDFRRTEMASQARIWPWAKVHNPKEAFMRYGEQLEDAASSTRHYMQWIDKHTSLSLGSGDSLDFIFVGIGGILLLRIVIQRGLWSPHALVALLMAAEVGAVTVGLGVDFYRYYLPVLLVNSVLVGITFGEVTTQLRHVFATQRRERPHARSLAGMTAVTGQPERST